MASEALPVNTSFSEAVPGLQLAIDSTSLGEFKTCPRRYQLAIVEGWEPKDQSVHLTFGILLHKAREWYEHKKLAGTDHEEALRQVVKELLFQTWDKDMKRGWISGHAQKTRYSLVLAAVWYLDKFGKDDPLQTAVLANGRPAVELSFRFDSGIEARSVGQSWTICGHLDRVVETSDQHYVSDIKTTGSALSGHFFAQFNPDNQFSLYTVGGQVAYRLEIAGIIVDGVQIGARFARFQRQLVPRSKQQIDEWWKELPFWLRLMEHCATSGHWPQNDKSCGNYGGCKFRGVCSRPNPSAAKFFLETNFQRRVWDPLVPR